MAIDNIGQGLKDTLNNAAQWAFQQYMRAFTVYIEAKATTLVTNPAYQMFGQRDQNVSVPAVTPQQYTISGTLLYANGQPWSYVEPTTRTAYQQNKVREDFGTLRLKVDGSGYALLQSTKLLNVDGFDFKLTSAARPHNVFGPPARYTFVLTRVD